MRIVAATNKNISQMTEENRFRSDLFYRLNSFIINLPPLRERREDIPILLDYYLRFFCTKLNKHIPEVDSQVYKALSQYDFPGNVRELRNMVERSIILTDGNKLRARDFMLNDVVVDEVPVEGDATFDLEELEKRTIIKALERTGFKKVEAALLLNITRQALDRRLEKYNLYY